MKIEGKVSTVDTHESETGKRYTALVQRTNPNTDVPFTFDSIHLGSSEVQFRVGQKVIVEVVE
jgi:hypothetical protein